MAVKLISRVKSHTTSQGTQGAATLALTVECIDHGFEHDDFTPLVALVSLSQPAASRNVRAIVGKVVQGYKLVKSDKADYGMKLAKVKDQNQGFDSAMLDKVRAMVSERKAIQSKDVTTFIKGDKAEPAAFEAKEPDAYETRAKTWVKAHTDVELAEKVKALELELAAYRKVMENKGKAVAH
jgi:hypothetical protein